MTMRHVRIAGGLLLAAVLGGCSTVHQVTIDAISDASRPLGTSYHLEVNDPTGGVQPEAHAVAVATIRDALGARGLYEAPASVVPDMVIAASYGVSHGYTKIVNEHNMTTMTGLAISAPPNAKAVVVYDKTLEITARAPATGATDANGRQKPGDELWSVQAKIADNKQEIGPYLPALASGLINYIGENPGHELTLPVESAHAQELLQRRRPAPAAAK